MEKTVIVIRDGEIKLRVPNAEIRNGVIRVGNNILINNDKIVAPHTKESVAAKIKAGKITAEIEAMGMAIGDNGNGLVCMWADDYDAKRRAEHAKQLAARNLLVTSSGKLAIACDIRDDVSGKVLHGGVVWLVSGLGKPFDSGVHQIRYAYVSYLAISDGKVAYKVLTDIFRDEQRRYHHQFDAMMDDESNDGVNPPRPVCKELSEIIDQIDQMDVEAAKLRRDVEAAADTDCSTTTGYIQHKYGKLALDMLNSGAALMDVQAKMNGYKDDPDYQEAVWGM